MENEEIKGWSQAEITTMTMAENLVWDIAQDRYPALPHHFTKWFMCRIVQVGRIIRQQ